MDCHFTYINHSNHVFMTKQLYKYGTKEAREFAQRELKDDVSIKVIYFSEKGGEATAVRRSS